MKKLRRNFERFCYRHQRVGIPNLMLYIAIASAVVYIMSMVDPSNVLYRLFVFDRGAILRGQVWRLLTFVFVPYGSMLGLLLTLLFYTYVGKAIEGQWGTFRFNLFYFTGLVLTDAAAMILGYTPSASQLNLSLVLAFATVFPESEVRLMFIIPLKMKYLAWFYFAAILFDFVVYPFSYNVFVLVGLLNYFLFFGSDIVRVLPAFLQPKRRPGSGSGTYAPQKPKAKTVRGKVVELPYRHKCTVCGRTEISDPHLEFRYCSRCSGYHCYCIEHINDHTHVQ